MLELLSGNVILMKKDYDSAKGACHVSSGNADFFRNKISTIYLCIQMYSFIEILISFALLPSCLLSIEF